MEQAKPIGVEKGYVYDIKWSMLDKKTIFSINHIEYVYCAYLLVSVDSDKN